MSKTIDEKVVSMQFDNKNFESNVQTSLSTIEKLKRSLNFRDSSKSLESLNAAANKVNMSGMSSAIDTVQAKFSALQVVGVTALANITNSALNAGKRIASALTIQPISTGLQEYETQINAVQTILANTQKEGTNIDMVNAALDELNTYADKTIYNFTEMTRNIGTFTAAGVKLDTSVNAIKGIANLAAVSGSTSQQASTAMYQLSQALAAGKVQLMDWNSVVNAGMGGQVFQDALIRTSELLGTGAKQAIATYGSFRESLTKSGWLTTEVLNETLSQFAGAYDKADLMAQGYTEAQADEIVKMAKTAEDAATKVKTFTQLWDVMKEAAQSGWAQTWRLIIGDFEEAKALFTPLADFFTGDNGIITAMSNARNALLESALGKGFGELSDKISKMLEPAKKAAETVTEVKDSIADLGTVVDDVILGKFGNGEERFNKLSEAGQNWYRVQNQVNEKLGNSKRYTEEQIAAQDKLLGVQKESNKATEESGEATTKLTDAQKTQLKELLKLSDAQLLSKGYTRQQVMAFRELESTAKQLGIPLDTFIDKMDEINGRWLLINSFKNIGQSIIKVFSTIGKAYRDIFEPMKPEQLFNIIAGFHRMTSSLVMTDETADKLRRTLRGLFAVIDIVSTFVGGSFRLAFKVLTTVLGAFDLSILDATAILGDALTAFRDMLTKNELITAVFEAMAVGIINLIDAIKELVGEISKLPQVKKFFEDLGKIDLTEIGSNILKGLKNGLTKGITEIPKFMTDLGLKLINAIKGVLGIHSPSTVFEAIGEFIVDGLWIGLKNGFSKIVDLVKSLGTTLIDTFNSIDFTKIFIMGSIIGFGLLANKALDIASSVFGGIGDIFGGISDILQSTSKWIDAKALTAKAEAMLSMAKALAILAAVVVIFGNMKLDTLKQGMIVLTILMGELLALSAATGKIKPTDVGKVSLLLISLSVSLTIMASAVRKLAELDITQLGVGLLGLAGLVAGMSALMYAFGKLITGDVSDNISKAGTMMIKMAIAIGLMVVVIKLLSGLSIGEILIGAAAVTAFVTLFAAMAIITRFSGGNISKAGSMMLKMSIAIGIMVLVIKMIAKMSISDLQKGIAVMAAFELLIGGFVIATSISPDSVSKAGSMMIKMSIAMGLMVVVIKMVAGISIPDITKGIIVMSSFLLMTTGFVYLAKFANGDMGKIGGLMTKMAAAMILMSVAIKIIGSISVGEIVKGLAVITYIGVLFGALALLTNIAGMNAGAVGTMAVKMSTAILILSGAILLLSLLKEEDIKKGTNAITQLMLGFALIIAASGYATDSVKTLTTLMVSIGLLIGAVVLLSTLDTSKVENATKGLTMVLAAFSLLIASTSLMKNVKGTLPTLLALSAVVAVLAVVIYSLGSLKPESAIASALSLSTLLLAISAAMVIVNTVGSVSLAGLGSLAAITAVVAVLAVIIYSLGSLEPESALSTAVSLSTLLLSMSAALAVLTVVGSFAPAALAGVGVLIALIAAVGTLIIAIGALVSNIPQLKTFLDEGIPVIEKIGYAIGSFFGNIISGFATGLTANLPEIGKNLGDFMTNLEPFIEGTKNIDESSMQGVKTLAEAFLVLIGANFIDSLTSIFTGGTSFTDFAEELPKLGEGLRGFSDALEGTNPENIKMAAEAAKSLAEMSKHIPTEGGIKAWFTGETSIANFADDLPKLGKGLKGFSDEMGDINPEGIKAGATAAKAIAEMTQEIPTEGGIKAWFTGETNIAGFANKLPSLGAGVKGFADSIGDVNAETIKGGAEAAKAIASITETIPSEGGVKAWFSGETSISNFADNLPSLGVGVKGFADSIAGINSESVTAGANAAKAIASITDVIPKEGGFAAWFSGEIDMEQFANDLPALGTAVSKFATNLGTEIDPEIVKAGANAAKAIAEMTEVIPNSGGIMGWFSGDVDMETFSAGLPKLGSAIKGFAEKLGDKVDPEIITAGANAAKKLAEMADTAPSDSSKIVSFGTNLESFGSSLGKYFKSMSSVTADTISSSNSAIQSVKDASKIDSSKLTSISKAIDKVVKSIKGLSSIPGDVASKFSSALKKLGETGTDSFVKAFDGLKDDMSDIADNAISGFKSGIEKGQKSAVTACETMAKACATAISNKKSSFESAGKDLGSGLVKGINAKQTAVYKAAYALGQKAVQGEKDGQKSNSPSKLTIQAGKWFGEGLVIGINRMGKAVYNSAHDLGTTASDSLTSVVSKLSRSIDADMDIQPKIRPVVDLTDVTTSANYINGLLSMSPSVDTLSSVQSLNVAMNRKRQNGSTADIVTAIDKMHQDLNKLEKPSYNINGVTYDDGSNITEAVQTIVKAALRERRV